jgi:hypothetical protein
MSLIPSSVQGAPNDNYFVAVDGGVMRDPVILPSEGNFGAASAALSMFNGITDPSLNPMRVIHYVPAVTGGGLQVGLYQAYMYGPSVGGALSTGYLFSGRGLGNGYAVFGFNNAGPNDAARMGKITGTGALQVVNVSSITAASTVRLAFVAGTAAAADVAITIVPNTSFSLTLPLNAVYNYEVIA